nr:hypothetical protein CFP56_24485 [Quercus suber]
MRRRKEREDQRAHSGVQERPSRPFWLDRKTALLGPRARFPPFPPRSPRINAGQAATGRLPVGHYDRAKFAVDTQHNAIGGI